jgi:sugar phosphate isomerase/epimerase
MRLGFYTYSYTDRLGMPVDVCLERIARTGYTGIDVSGTHGPSADPNSVSARLRRQTRETAGRLGLRIEAVITHAHVADTLANPAQKPLDLAGSIDLAAELGAPIVTFHMGGYPSGVPRPDFWRTVVAAIRHAAQYAAARHIALAVDGIWPCGSTIHPTPSIGCSGTSQCPTSASTSIRRISSSWGSSPPDL